MLVTHLTGSTLLAALLLGAASTTAARQGEHPPVAPAGWVEYTDRDYAFRVSYPTGLVPLRDVSPDHLTLVRVRFVDARLARGELAPRQPGQFTVSVIDPGGTVNDEPTLHGWLEARGWLRPQSTVTSVSLDGADAGLDIVDPTQMAPNEATYFAARRRVYALRRSGPTGEAIERTFQLLER